MTPDARFLSALATACAVLTLGGGIAAAQAAKAKPIPGVVQGKDWRYLQEDSLRLVFIHLPSGAPAAKPKAYLRYEERANRGTREEPMWSARSQFEFDCGAGMFRTLDTLFFAQHNLAKPYPASSPPARNWVKPEQGSIAAAAFNAACKK